MIGAADVSTSRLLGIPGGQFIMGADDRRRDERPAHAVTLAPFRAAERPVSNDEYAAFVEQTGALAPPFWSQDGFRIPDAPVVGISWHDAVDYCDWLSGADGHPLPLADRSRTRVRSARRTDGNRLARAPSVLAGGGVSGVGRRNGASAYPPGRLP